VLLLKLVKKGGLGLGGGKLNDEFRLSELKLGKILELYFFG